MLARLRVATLLSLVLTSVTAHAQSWSFGAGVGPFVFGHFTERTFTVGNETGTTRTHQTLSATTRPGLSVDIGHDVNDWLGWRAEGTFTHAPLKVKSTSGNGGVTLDAGNADVATFTVPLVLQLNRHGAFRFHLMAGPAYARYDFHGRTGTTSLASFTGNRSRFGVMAGGGLDWWLSDRFAVEGQIDDVVTASPLERSDYSATTSGIKFPRTHNVHTTVGLRYRF